MFGTSNHPAAASMRSAFIPLARTRAQVQRLAARAAVLGLLQVLATAAAAQAPSGRIYVRRIEFEGVAKIDDQVLRRKMLQLEGTYLDTEALQRSLRRLDALPYVELATARLRPVPDRSDLVDIVVTITEAPARRYGGGGGYSPSQLGSLHAYFVNENLFGTGQRFSLRVDGGQLSSVDELSYTNPYARPAGVSRNLRWSSRRMRQASAHASDLDTRLDSLRLEYGYATGRPEWTNPPAAAVSGPPAAPPPAVPEPPGAAETRANLNLGLEAGRVGLGAGTSTSSQLLAWIAANGDPGAGSETTRYTELALLAEWRYDTRNRAVFPERGLEQTLSARVAMPGGDVQYYLADYHAAKYWTLGAGWTAELAGELGFAAAYGGATTSLPPYLDWFAGGPGTVRGYSAGTLGPRDSLDHPYGGNLLAAGRLEATAPWPEKWRKRLRLGFFVDAGNVFSTENVAFTDASGRNLDYGFAWSKLRGSAGIDLRLLIPLGELSLSYAIPAGADRNDPNPFLRDRTDRFQIALGVEY